jgi:DNA helicase-2/ATP-dependent DNA helicase PcrA
MPKPAPKPGTPISPRQALNMIAKYKSGQKVLHSKFGEGVVIASKVRGDDEELDVKFANYGLKRLSAAIANLVLLEDED